MFRVTGIDITDLSGRNLRTLLVRLNPAEVRSQGCSASSLTAGGERDTPDDGVDVRVDCVVPLTTADAIPRTLAGSQVNKSDMGPSGIHAGICPHALLRPSITELAVGGGTYIIDRAKCAVADKPLVHRQTTMRQGLDGSFNDAKSQTDPCGRERLATWINWYPDLVPRVRDQLERQLSDWSSIGRWHGPTVGQCSRFLLNDQATLSLQ